MRMPPPPPQRDIIEYTTVTSDRVADFDKKVNSLFKGGWELYNNPTHFVCENAMPVHLIYTQTMVKYG